MKKTVICVGRQFGSGGREIARQLAEYLNYAYYDKELLAQAAKESGYCQDIFKRADEISADPMVFSCCGLIPSYGLFSHSDYLSNEKLFLLQSETIEKIADKGNAIIVGRCADYILRDREDVISIFISDEKENRIERVMKRSEKSHSSAYSMIRKTDKMRASYYNFYADRSWGEASNYDLCINRNAFTEEQFIQIIKTACEG